MSKHKFTNAQRFAVWKHHGFKCYWCDEPLRLQETTVDHFIPEYLEDKPEELKKARKDYGLSPDFVVNGYCNWLPCHFRCNRRKAAELPWPILQAAHTLRKLARDAETIRLIERGMKNDVKKDKLLAKVGIALEENILTKDEILVWLADPELQNDEDIQILRREIYLDVDQHYVDFLNRKPDPDSLAFWNNQIAEGQLSVANKADAFVQVSAAFFLSTEFYDSGYLVYRMYKAAFGSSVGASTVGGAHMLSVPIVRLSEFVPAIQQIGEGVIEGKGNWRTQLESNKAKFMSEFVSRSRFTFAYPMTMTPAQFVDSLNTNADNILSAAGRDQLVNDLMVGTKTRAQVLRALAEDTNLINAEFNRAFVLLQYFGYLRRNPDDKPDIDFSGYDFWLRKLDQFAGNFVEAEMIKAFITSDEYRQRFGS